MFISSKNNLIKSHKNTHEFRIPGDTTKDKNRNWTRLVDGLNNTEAIKDYIEDQLMVKIVSINVHEPATLDGNFSIVTSYSSDNDLDAQKAVSQLTQIYRQICHSRADVFPLINGFIVSNMPKCGCGA